MAATTASSVPFLNLSPIEIKDEFDERLERCHFMVKGIIEPLSSESEAHDALNTTVCKSAIAHEEVCIGLLTGILVDPPSAPRFYRDLSYVTRDGMVIVISTLNVLVLEKFWKLTDTSRSQIIWICKEMIKTSIVGVDGLIVNILRNISSGDVSSKNVNLAEEMVNLLTENRFWLDKNPIMISTSLYTYLRLIMDHSSPSLTILRTKEVDFCMSLLKEKFADCVMIGRDLVRLLQNVSRIPEFEEFWKDLLHCPSKLLPGFNGVVQLMQTRTSRRFLQCRLTPEQERKVIFLCHHVKFGQQKRYQEWFQRQYLSTPESQSLRCDLIRFICGVIHPSNELLCSDIIPRWAVIGWILSSCTSNVAASNAKLALFYDWLFYDPDKDNIMNIEPAILVMHHSLRSHPVISATLLDFLCRILHNFCPQLTSYVKSGINCAFQQILEKRVLPSLDPLFNGKIDPELKKLIRFTFPELTGQVPPSTTTTAPSVPTAATNEDVKKMMKQKMVKDKENDENASFSDEDDENVSKNASKVSSIPSAVNNGGGDGLRSLSVSGHGIPDPSEVTSHLEQLPGDLKEVLIKLMKEKDNEIRCQLMETIVTTVAEDPEFDQETCKSLSIVLVSALRTELTTNIFPKDAENEESLEDSIGNPVFVLIRSLFESSDSSSSPGSGGTSRYSNLLSLTSELSSHVSIFSYSILYYLQVSGKSSDKSSYDVYKDVARSTDMDLQSFLLNDLRNCSEDDVQMFFHVLPSIYRIFENICSSNPNFLYLIVSTADSFQLQGLICSIITGHVRMIKKDSIINLINASLEWETFEQTFLWQLISAHNSVSVENILPVLPKLDYKDHSEALTGILLLLQRKEPFQELVKPILSRELRANDYFAVTILEHWSRNDPETLSNLIKNNLNKSITSPVKSKGKKGNSGNGSISTFGKNILHHLDELRIRNPSFFSNETIQTALLNAQNSCNDTLKTKLSDLFALIEDEDKNAGVTKKGGKGSSASGAKSGHKSKKVVAVVASSSDTEESEDEAPIQTTTKKGTVSQRKKRKTKLEIDSD